MRSLIILIAAILSIVLSLGGCRLWWTNSKPSYLIVAVDSLSSEAFYCSENDAEFSEGFGVLCKDSVRFTHAFTTSTMAQPALISVLTGLYPYKSGVFHNGAQFLAEDKMSAAEVAFDKGYRTALFSGGPPIWRKSGLDQGFELFEDNINVLPGEVYRPVLKNFEMFIDWASNMFDDRPFFSVVYVPDLQFEFQKTVDNLGQERARNFDSQLREINESFAHLVGQMKQQKIWDNTYVILLGLNGRTGPGRDNDIDATNLRSDNTQVLLMIKPARKARDAGLDWTIDSNVTIADVGVTLFDLLEFESLEVQSEDFPVVSLRSALEKPNVDWAKDRYILTESGWSNWRDIGDDRMALRLGNLLYIHDAKPIIYNSLSDQFETQPIRFQDAITKQSVNDMIKVLDELRRPAWRGIGIQTVEKLNLFKGMQNPNAARDELKIRLAHLIRQRPWDKQVVGWMARLAVADKNWELLEKLGIENYNNVWVYIAKRMQKANVDMPNDGCWSLLQPRKKSSYTRGECEDSEFIAFAQLMRNMGSRASAQYEDKFIKTYFYSVIDEEISALNFQNSLAWDADMSIPAGPRLVELALLLPEYKAAKQMIRERAFVKND